MPFLNRICSPGARVALLIVGLAPAPHAATPSGVAAPAIASTQAVQAAFTLNLTRFISWPESAFSSPEAPLVIGTFPRDPINAELDAAARGEVVNGHPVRIVRIQSVKDLPQCHVLFMSAHHGRPAAMLPRVARRPVLTISDADGFLELGGHVRLVEEPPRLSLRISVDNLKSSGLEGRAQLLRLAAKP